MDLTYPRQRVPMVDAAMLEDRTRPALDGSAASRLRYFRWPTWADPARWVLEHEPRPTRVRHASHRLADR